MTRIRIVLLGLLVSLLLSAAAATTASAASLGVMGWGSNAWGQLGNGTTKGSDVPVATSGLSEVKAVAAGWQHSLALLRNGTVMAWGNNTTGELGNGTTTPSLVPVVVPGLSGVTAISAGSNYSMALLSNGKVMAWGANNFGQLGMGNTANSEKPVAVPGLSEVTAIAAGMRISMALLRNGKVMVWGYNGPATQGGELGIGTPIGPEACGGVFCSKRPMPVVKLSEVTAVAGGHSHNLALLKNGTVMAWGGNSYGQLGVGREKLPSGKDRSYVPVQAKGLTEATAISAGSKYSLALLRNGTMMTWGKNVYGELGLGDKVRRLVPTAVPGLSGVTAISAGGGAKQGAGHSLARLSNGTVMAWGGNSVGELGIGNTTDSSVPVAVRGLTGAQGISSGAFHSLAFG